MGTNLCVEAGNDKKMDMDMNTDGMPITSTNDQDASKNSKEQPWAAPRTPAIAVSGSFSRPTSSRTSPQAPETAVSHLNADGIPTTSSTASTYQERHAQRETEGIATHDTITKDTTDNDNTLRNALVAVIGTGPKVWALADKRIHEQGRLLVLLTDEKPSGRYTKDDFTWMPPQRVAPVTEQARQMVRKYNSSTSRRWMRKGPDIMELKKDETYEIEDQERGVRVLLHGKVVWELSAMTLVADVSDVAAANLGVTKGLFTATPVGSATTCFGVIAFCLIHLTAVLMFGEYEKEDGAPYARVAVIVREFGFAQLLFFTTVGGLFWGASSVGVVDDSTKAKFRSVLAMLPVQYAVFIIPFGSNTLTSFLACDVVVMCALPLLVMMHLHTVAQPGFQQNLRSDETAPDRVRVLGRYFAWPRYWKWTFVTIGISFGPWLQYYAVGVAYVLVNTGAYKDAANILLPIVVTVMEGMYVAVAQMGYGRFVYNARATGNHTYMLSVVISLNHAYAESVKLVAIVSGTTICADNPNGVKWPAEGSCDPYSWVISVCMGFVISLVSRCGWSRYFVGRTFAALRLKKVAAMLAPSFATKLHDEAKYYWGYSRYTVVGAVMLRNILVGKGAIVFNIPATWCCIAMLGCEVVEDFVVGKEIIPHPPSPKPEGYMQYDAHDPCQLYTFPTSPMQELESRKSRRSSLHGEELQRTLSVTAPVLLRTDGDYFPRALPLHGTRDMSVAEVGPILLCASFFSLYLFELLLGVGYFLGICDLPLTEADRFKEAFLWPIPLDICRY